MKFNKLLFIGFVFLFSCGPKASHNKAIFKYNDASGITSLDPLKANNLSNNWATQQIFNGLVQLDANGELQPCLAKRWDILDSAQRFVFHLRNDVLFHENVCFTSDAERKLKASDVVFSLQRAANDANAGWILKNVQSLDNKKHIVALNDSVVEIVLETPSAQFLSMLTTSYAFIVSEKAVQFYGADFRNNAVGTGPFFLVKWHENEKLVLNKNSDYFEVENGVQLPYLDGVAITFVKDRQTELLEFLQGHLDMMSGLDAAYKDELLTFDGKLKEKYAQQFTMVKKPYLNTEYLGFQLSDSSSVFQNKYVRKALSYALHREKLIAMIRNNIGDYEVHGIVPKALRLEDKTPVLYAFDEQKMKENLALAGFQHPSEVPAFTLSVDVAYADIATIILNQWRNAGFQVKLDVLDRPTLKSSVAKGHLAFFRASWIGDYPDAENYLSLFYSENFSPNGPNYTHYRNKKYDDLFMKAQQESDDSTRFALYAKMDELAMEDCPVIILYYDEIVRFCQNNIQNMTVNAMNGLQLTRVKKQNAK